MAHPLGSSSVGRKLLPLGLVLLVSSACTESRPDPQVLCFETANGDGSRLITCDNGVNVAVADGLPGRDGQSCDLADNGNGTITLLCEDGSTYTVRDGRDGASCRVASVDSGGAAIIECDDGTGATVSDGADGTSCMVSDDPLRNRIEIACSDGTTATVAYGDDGEDCSVSSDENTGAVLVSCGDDGATVLQGEAGTSCSVLEDDEGTITIDCGDGTTEVVIGGSRRIGTVVGTAYYFGLQEHSGITVEVLDTDLSATTAPDGSYQIDDIPNGSHTLRFSAPRYIDQEVQVPILPGLFEVGDVTLMLAEQLTVGTQGIPITRCGDAILQQTGSLSIADILYDDRFGEPGGQSLFTAEGQIELFEGGEQRVVSERANGFFSDCTPDGEAVFWVRDLELGYEIVGEFFVWRAETGESDALDFIESLSELWISSDSATMLFAGFGPDSDGEELFEYDIATGDFASVENNLSGSVSFSDTGQSYIWSSGQTYYYKVVGEEAGGSFDTAAFDVFGIEFLADSDLLLVWQADTGQDPMTISLHNALDDTSSDELTSVGIYQFLTVDPGGLYVAWGEEVDPPVETGIAADPLYTLLVWDVDLAAPVATFPEPTIRIYDVAIAGGGMTWTDFGSGSYPVSFFDLAAGAEVTTTVLSITPPGVWLSPDGAYAAVSADDNDGQFLQVVNLGDGATVYRVGETQFDDWAPDSASYVIKPDGGGMAFRRVADSAATSSVFFAGIADDADYQYSPEGGSLTVQGDLGTVLWRIESGTSVLLAAPELLTTGAVYLDEATLVYTKDWNGREFPDARWDLRLYDIAGAESLPVDEAVWPFDAYENEGGDEYSTFLVYVDLDRDWPDYEDDGWFVIRPLED